MQSNLEFINLKSRLTESAVVEVLSLAVGIPAPSKLEAISASYFNRNDLSIVGVFSGDQVIGIIGIELTGDSKGVIKHISVLPDCRKLGIGRKMIDYVMGELKLSWIVAETDAEAEGFYSHCGFKVTPIDSKYPGVRRYRCEKAKGAIDVSGLSR